LLDESAGVRISEVVLKSLKDLLNIQADESFDVHYVFVIAYLAFCETENKKRYKRSHGYLA